MKTQTDIFFFISSVGFITLWILVAIFLVYLIRTMHSFSKIMKQIEKDIEKISETTKDMFLNMRESTVFNFLFGKKRKSRKE